MIGLAWIYHGFFPKLYQIAPLEQVMTGSLGFSTEITFLLTKIAGVVEILFGILFIWFYQVRAVQLISIAALVALLIFAAIMTPFILLEAFNPVTTNIPLIVLGFYLFQQNKPSSVKNI